MPNANFDAQLVLLESQLHELMGSLIDGSPASLQNASTKFHRLALDLFQIANDAKGSRLGSPGALRKINVLSSGMVTFRESVLRCSAYTDRALGVLIPTTGEKSTYAGSRVYGSPAKRSGTFTAFSA
ncbi:MAG: hypothetical protein ABIZ09_12595 [Rhodoferax sp.]